jgi:hypothetical protein
VPFIRHTRDKRGYDTTYVMHQYRPVQGPQRTRVLYLFRSPAHVKIGRQPLDEEIREALEHTHPDVSFDWITLGRESAVVRSEEPRERGPRGQQRPPRPSSPPPPIQPVVADDHSLLGRVAGAERASKLRAAYLDVLQRIGRRSRTPEERDRLTARIQRLNPDEWPDEATVRAQLDTAPQEWAAIAAELPARRRGRRGGRHRERLDSATPAAASDADTDQADAGIMTVEVQGEHETEDAAGPGDQGTREVEDEGTRGPGGQGTNVLDALQSDRAAGDRRDDDDRGGAE